MSRCAKAARSLVTAYNFREGGSISVQTSTKETHAIAQQQQASIQTLAGKTVSHVTILPLGGDDSTSPPGTHAISVVSAAITVLLDVSSKIENVDAEIAKLQQKIKASQDAVSKQTTLMGRPGFSEHVSEVVQLTEKKKLEDASTAVQNYERTLSQFQKLKVDA